MSDQSPAPRPTVLDRLIGAALIPMLLALSLPLELYLRNHAELNARLVDVLPVSALLFLAATIILFLALTATRIIRIDRAALLVLSVLFYLFWIQANLFDWEYGPIEAGSWQEGRYTAIDAVCWLIGAAAITFMRRRAYRVVRVANRWALLIVTVALIPALLRAPYGHAPRTIDLAPRFSFSPERNVVVILLDEVQSNIFAEFVAWDPELRSLLDGFINYPNTVSNACHTSLSVPMVLTSRYFDNSQQHGAFISSNFKDHSIPSFFVEQGYDSHIYPANCYFPDSVIHPRVITNYRTRPFDSVYAAKLFDLTLFAALPHALKQTVYDEGRWRLRNQKKAIAWINAQAGATEFRRYEEPTSFTDYDQRFTADALTQLRTDHPRPTFKLYHLDGGHHPYIYLHKGRWVRANNYRAKLAYKLVLLKQFLTLLRTSGVFDSSLVVLMSDHGAGRGPDTQTFKDPDDGTDVTLGFCTSRAHALLMIKDFGAEGPLRPDDRRLQLSDLLSILTARIRDNVPIETFAREIPNNRVLRYISSHWQHYQPYVRDYLEFLIVDDPHRRHSIIPFHPHKPPFNPAECALNRVRELHHRKRTNELPRAVGPGRFELAVRRAPGKALLGLARLNAPEAGKVSVIIDGQKSARSLTHGEQTIELWIPSAAEEESQISFLFSPESAANKFRFIELFDAVPADDSATK